MQIYNNEKDIAAALADLSKTDDRLAAAFEKYGTPPLRQLADGFAGLARLLISQQVSTAAAATIQSRFEALVGEVEPARVLALSVDELRGCGLSGAKERYVRGLAEAVISDGLDLPALRHADDETVYKTLTSLKGVGPWTAQCYLLFALRRCDLFPAGDLALQHGVRLMYEMDEKPGAEALADFAKRWQPHRAAAARLLWSYYNGEMAEMRGK